MDRDEYYEACLVALAALADCFQKFEDAYLAGGRLSPDHSRGAPYDAVPAQCPGKAF